MGSNNIETLSFGILTYKRELILHDLLLSIAADFPWSEIKHCEIVVRDNSGNCSAEVVVREFLENNPEFTVSYSGTKVPAGIVEGRNYIANNFNHDWLFFIDDDQMLTSGFLNRVIEAFNTCEKKFDVAKFGLVNQYDVDSNDFSARKYCDSPVFQREISVKHGDYVPGDCCDTAGVLIKHRVFEVMDDFFRDEWNVDGGEDIDFFYRAEQKGVVIMSFRDEKVIDRIPKERLNIFYVLKDAAGRGSCRAKFRIVVKGENRLDVFAKSFKDLLILVAKTLVIVILKPRRWREMLVYIARLYGQVRSSCGGSIGLYKK